MYTDTENRGFSTVEVLVVSAIAITVVTAITASYHAFFALARNVTETTAAGLMLEEGAEAVVYLRDMGWDTHIAPLALGTEYALEWTGTGYRATTTPQAGSLSRSVVMSAVSRTATGVVSASGTTDPQTRRVLITVENAAGVERARGEMLIHNAYAE